MSDLRLVDNLYLVAGTDFARAYPLDGVNLVGASAVAKVRDLITDAVVASFTCAIDSTAKTLTISATDTASALWTWTHGTWDILLVDGDSAVYEVVHGRARLSKAASRA